MEQKRKPEARVWTVAEAAAVVNMPLKTCYAAIKRGDIPSIRIGGRVLVPKDKLSALIDGAAA